ncbi:MAG: GGDEF domain-containing protein [Gemmatimonadetes bacterium]|nr:GGDEF domain-containing protein [Gemmatimonadota bacterium]
MWNHFHATREWPLARKVEVELDQLLDKERGLRAVCDAIGRDAIVCEDLLSAEAKVKLRVRGVAECPNTGQEVDAFLTLLRYAGVRYSEDTNAEIGVADFAERSGIAVDLAKRAFQYALLDGGRFWRSGGGGQFTLDRFSRRLRQVKTLDELDEQIRLDFAEPTAPSFGRAAPQPSAAGRVLSDLPQVEDAEVDADAVTGGPSRKALNAVLPAMIVAAESATMPLGLVMADLDYFKKVNDTHGHIEADKVLAEAHAAMEAVVRGKGRAYRFGGEEFMIVLPNHDSSETVAVAERVRRTIESQRLNNIAVTLSLGVAAFPSDATELEPLLKLADEAVYEAKESGRNCVRAHGGTGNIPDSLRESAKKETGPAVTLSITSRADRMESERHEYTIEVKVANDSASVLRDWTIQVELPRAVVPPNESNMFRVEARRDTRLATYRMTQEQHSGKPIYPGDHELPVFNFHFVMTGDSHDLGEALLGIPVTATLFVGDRIVAEASRPFSELQQY